MHPAPAITHTAPPRPPGPRRQACYSAAPGHASCLASGLWCVPVCASVCLRVCVESSDPSSRPEPEQEPSWPPLGPVDWTSFPSQGWGPRRTWWHSLVLSQEPGTGVLSQGMFWFGPHPCLCGRAEGGGSPPCPPPPPPFPSAAGAAPGCGQD